MRRIGERVVAKIYLKKFFGWGLMWTLFGVGYLFLGGPFSSAAPAGQARGPAPTTGPMRSSTTDELSPISFISSLRALEKEALTQEIQGNPVHALYTYVTALNRFKQGWTPQLSKEEKAGASALAEVYLIEMERLIDKTEGYGIDLPCLESLQSLRVSESFNRTLRWFLALAEMRVGDRTAGQSLFEKLGLINQWYVLGSFDNQGNSGFDQVYPPEKERYNLKLDLKGVYDGVLDKIGWRVLGVHPYTGYVDFSQLLYPAKDAVGYALTYLQVLHETTVRVGIASSTYTKMWVDGKEVYSFEGDRPVNFDQAVLELTLGPGFHPLLIKTAVTHPKPWGLRLSIFDPDTWDSRIKNALVTLPDSLPLLDSRLRGNDKKSKEGVLKAFQVLTSPSQAMEYYQNRIQSTQRNSSETTPPLNSLGSPSPRPSPQEGEGDHAHHSDALAWDYFHRGELEAFMEAYDHEKERLPEEDFLKAYQAEPDFAPFEYALAHATVVQGEMQTEKGSDRLRVHLERILEKHPEALAVSYDLIQFYLTTFKSLVKARALIQQVEEYLTLSGQKPSTRGEEEHPSLPWFQLLKLQYLEEKGVGSSAYQAQATVLENQLSASVMTGQTSAATALSSASDHPSEQEGWVLSRLKVRAQQEEQQGRFQDALNVYFSILQKNNLDFSVYDQVASLFYRKGELKEALEELDRERQLNLYRMDLLERKALWLESSGKVLEALQVVNEMVTLNPQLPLPLRLAGKYLELLGKEKEALYFYRKALQLEPQNNALKRYLSLIAPLKGEEDGEEARVSAYHINWKGLLPLKKSYSSQVVQLVRSQVSELTDLGTRRDIFENVFKILAPGALSDFQKMYVWYFKDEQEVRVHQAKVFHSDGSSQEADIQDADASDGYHQAKVLTFSNLQVGDVVDVEYEQVDLKEGLFGTYYGDDFLFSHHEPTLMSQFVLLVPKGKKVYNTLLNGAPPPKEMDQGGYHVYQWALKDLPQISQEPFMPPLDELVPLVRVSTFETWEELANWYWNLYESQEDTSPAIQEKVKELTRHLSTLAEKIQAIYRFVVREIQYNDKWEFGIHGYKPYKASQIFEKRIGDCKDKALLLNVMLHEIGVHSFPVLIYLSQQIVRGKEDFTRPMFDYFNHCISCAILPNGKKWFLDGTASNWGSRETPQADTGARVLVVRKNGSELVTIPYLKPVANLLSKKALYTLSVDGMTTADYTLQAQGNMAASYRALFQDTNQARLLLEQFWGRSYPGTKVQNLQVGKIDDLEKPVVIHYQVLIPNFVKTIEDGQLQFQPLTPHFDLVSYVELSNRTYDLLLSGNTPHREETSVVFHLPAGYTVETSPSPLTFKEASPFFSFQAESIQEQAPNRLTLTWAETLLQTRIPSADYPAFRERVQTISHWFENKVVLKKK